MISLHWLLWKLLLRLPNDTLMLLQHQLLWNFCWYYQMITWCIYSINYFSLFVWMIAWGFQSITTKFGEISWHFGTKGMSGSSSYLDKLVDASKWRTWVVVAVTLDELVDASEWRAWVVVAVTLDELVDASKWRACMAVAVTMDDLVDASEQKSWVVVAVTLDDLVDTSECRAWEVGAVSNTSLLPTLVLMPVVWVTTMLSGSLAKSKSKM